MNTIAIEALHQIADSFVTFYEGMQDRISVFDKQLSEQVNEILHHEEFQKIEGSWRGLYYLVSNTKTDDLLKIKFLNFSKMELNKHCKKYRGESWSQSMLFKKLHDDIYGVTFEEPFGCLVGDYYFDHTPPDIEVLRQMANITKAIHAPFITAPSPKLLHESTNSWQDLVGVSTDIDIVFQQPCFTEWNKLRDTDNARYLGMAMPRCLGRLPYTSKNNSIDEFTFEEDIKGSNHEFFCWINAAYIMACNINRAFSYYGWCSLISGNEFEGAIYHLPTTNFPYAEWGKEMNCSTEIAIDSALENKFIKNGFMPLLQQRNFAFFDSSGSFQKPMEYDDAEATEVAYKFKHLNYLFPICRFTQYLRCILRDQKHLRKDCQSREEIEHYLNTWLYDYLSFELDDWPHPDPYNTIRKPLASASVEVKEMDDFSGYYTFRLFLCTHDQRKKVFSVGLTTDFYWYQ